MKIITKGRVLILLGIICFGLAIYQIYFNSEEETDHGIKAVGELCKRRG